MALPINNTPITPTQLYPDRIRLNYRYRIGEQLNTRALCRVLRQRGFVRTSDQLQFRGSYVADFNGSEVSAFISVPRGRPFLNIYIDINPLSALRRGRRLRRAERSYDDRGNWLSARQVREDNEWVWEVANDLIWQHEHIAYELAGRIASDLGNSTIQIYQGVTVDRLELTCDFAERHPATAVTRMRPAFQSAFRTVRVNDVQESPSASERVEGSLQVLHGDWRAGATFRLYAKTDQRIRLECELRKNGLEGLGIRRSLTDDAYRSDFAIFFQLVAERVVDQFNLILGDRPNLAPPSDDAMELITGIASTVRDREFALRVIDTLAAQERVLSNLDGARIRRLFERGYLERVERGIYRIPDRWRPALADVQRLLEGGMGFPRGVAA